MPVRVEHEDFSDIHEWHDYLDDILCSALIDAACIYGPGGKLLASGGSSGVHLAEGEYAALRGALVEFRYPEHIAIGRRQYRVLLSDGRRGCLAEADDDGRRISVCKTRRLVIVGLHARPAGDEECSRIVMELGDVMFTKGF